jgi:uncharacterized protein (TIGR02996 family)
VTPKGETPVPELRALTDHIRESPDDRARWVALADWLQARGRADEAVAVRVLWRTLRDNLACASLEATLADVARNAGVLGAIAREKQRQADETPPV